MARRAFFSFHYQRDVWRINQIRNIPNIIGCSAAGFQDASLWEEAKKTSDASVKKLIDDALHNTTVTVVFIGNQTSNRKFINYEIEKSIARGNGLVGIQIHHLKDSRQTVPYGGLCLIASEPAEGVHTYGMAAGACQCAHDQRPFTTRRNAPQGAALA